MKLIQRVFLYLILAISMECIKYVSKTYIPESEEFIDISVFLLVGFIVMMDIIYHESNTPWLDKEECN